MQHDSAQPVAANAQAIERYRGYLLLVARMHWNPRLLGKLDPSDVVQQTMIQALQALPSYRGGTSGEMAGWLRQILTRCLADQARDFGRHKRNVARERSLDSTIEQSSARLEAWLDDRQTSPSLHAERNEHLAALAAALAELPAPQQEAVVLHHLHGLGVAEIAEQMHKTPAAVAGLLKRGLRTLRTQLNSGDHRETRRNAGS